MDPASSPHFPERLTEGYRAFLDDRFVREQSRYEQLAESGQTPKIMLIGCCDSRVSPEVIFDASPGEMFVVRNVANLVPPYEPDGQFHATSAALEFAVQSLKVTDILVMGHGRCGGISAALDPDAEPLSPGDFIGKWMGMLKPVAEQIQGAEILTQAERQRALERVSIRNSIANLRTFPCVRILEEKGRIQLHGAWFDISTGELWIMDAATGDFKRPSA